jgi:hypothetical protein
VAHLGGWLGLEEGELVGVGGGFGAFFTFKFDGEVVGAAEDLFDAVEGVDVVDGFVGADAGDAGEAEGEAGVVTFGAGDLVEGDFEDDGGLDDVVAAVVFEGFCFKACGEVGDFGIGGPE